jgi:hypothetical protein
VEADVAYGEVPVVKASEKVKVEKVTLCLDQVGIAVLQRRRVPSYAERLPRWNGFEIGHAAVVRPW